MLQAILLGLVAMIGNATFWQVPVFWIAPLLCVH